MRKKCTLKSTNLKHRKDAWNMSKPRIVISLTDSQLKYVEQEAKAKGLTKSAVIALLIEGAKSHGKEKKYA